MATKSTALKTTVKKAPVVKKVAVTTPTTSSLDARLFSYKVSPSLLTQVLHVYRDNLHQNTSQVKTRGELTRTTRKIYKQKGTGNARHGSRMAPQFVGGGVVFGPTGVKPGNLKANRKMKAAALAGLLSIYAKDNLVEMLSTPDMKKPDLKSVKSHFQKENTLLVHSQESPLLLSSVRNLDNLTFIEAARLNAYQVANSRYVVLTPSAQENLVKRLLPLIKK